MKLQKYEQLFSNYLVRDRSKLNRYSVSALIIFGSFAFIYALDSLHIAPTYSITLLAIMLTAVHGGFGPALMSSLIGAMALNFFLYGTEPRSDYLFFITTSFWIRFVLYFVTSIFIAALTVEIKRIYRMAEEAKVLTEIANAEKDKLIRVIAHDLRNPLGVIVGYSDMLNIKNFPNDRVRDVAQKIAATAMEVTCLIDDLLVQPLSNKEKPMTDLKPVRVDKLLKNVVEAQSAYAARKGISIDLRVPADDLATISVKADVRKLARVFQNILDNAIKYSPMNSKVIIDMTVLEKKVQIRFIDKGPGIHVDDVNKLFKAWGRTRNETTSKEVSTGLGLSICKELVDSMGGTIQFSNMYPRGSNFVVTFPTQFAMAEKDAESEISPIGKVINL